MKAYSAFYFDFEITQTNQKIDFAEIGQAAITAVIQVGSYTPTAFCIAVKTALDAVGDYTYQVAFNRQTRKMTISSDGSFKVLGATGPNFGSTALAALGFNEVDTANAMTHSGSNPAGRAFNPQIYLQDYVSPEDYQQAVDAKVATTASGAVEVVKFGIEKFMECNIWLQTNVPQGEDSLLRTDLNGVENLRNFMKFCVTKAPMEFVPDETAPDKYWTMILEATPTSADGVGYKLQQMYDRGLWGYFQSGKLKFRVIEDNQ